MSKNQRASARDFDWVSLALSVGFFFFFCFALILWWLLLCFALFALFALLNCSVAEGRHVSLSVSSAVTSHVFRGKTTSQPQQCQTSSSSSSSSSGRVRVWVRLWLCGELVVNLPCSGRMSSPQNLLGVGFLRYSYTVVSQLGGSSPVLLSLSLSLSL